MAYPSAEGYVLHRQFGSRDLQHSILSSVRLAFAARSGFCPDRQVSEEVPKVTSRSTHAVKVEVTRHTTTLRVAPRKSLLEELSEFSWDRITIAELTNFTSALQIER